jgi:hypothetical protein
MLPVPSQAAWTFLKTSALTKTRQGAKMWLWPMAHGYKYVYNSNAVLMNHAARHII